jgi:hypothetical protein
MSSFASVIATGLGRGVSWFAIRREPHCRTTPLSSPTLRRGTYAVPASTSTKSPATVSPVAPQESPPVKEYELYVPLFLNDGTLVKDEFIDHLGERLLDQFGGCTFFPQPNKGLWKMGDVVFRDNVVIFRVLTRQVRSARKFFRELKRELLRELQQEAILIVEKDAQTL